MDRLFVEFINACTYLFVYLLYSLHSAYLVLSHIYYLAGFEFIGSSVFLIYLVQVKGILLDIFFRRYYLSFFVEAFLSIQEHFRIGFWLYFYSSLEKST